MRTPIRNPPSEGEALSRCPLTRSLAARLTNDPLLTILILILRLRQRVCGGAVQVGGFLGAEDEGWGGARERAGALARLVG